MAEVGGHQLIMYSENAEKSIQFFYYLVIMFNDFIFISILLEKEAMNVWVDRENVDLFLTSSEHFFFKEQQPVYFKFFERVLQDKDNTGKCPLEIMSSLLKMFFRCFCFHNVSPCSRYCCFFSRVSS